LPERREKRKFDPPQPGKRKGKMGGEEKKVTKLPFNRGEFHKGATEGKNEEEHGA